MSRDRELRYLAHILDSILRIEQRASGGRDAFMQDDVLQDATLRRLETLADATTHLSPDLRARHPHVPWREIADFRNRVAHGYLDVDIRIVWDVIAEDLPPLKTVVEQELRERGAQPS